MKPGELLKLRWEMPEKAKCIAEMKGRWGFFVTFYSKLMQ